MTADLFEYDLALSFASEDRPLAEQFADLLARQNVKVFLDEYRPADTDRWGKDILDHLVNLYARKARYCLLLVSQYYPLKTWTEAEQTSLRERALRDPNEYILIIQADDSEVPGMAKAKGYKDLRRDSVENLVTWLDEKLRQPELRPGPPPQSHDLRSGNVPRQEQT
jgi:hypothetical protein